MATELYIRPIGTPTALKDQVYASLKQAVTSLDIYANREEIRLDERRLSEELGVSRTPVRETLARLAQEGFVQNIPRRGMFVVRKNKREVLEMIQVWAALEGMAARLITDRAGDAEIARLRRLFSSFDDGEVRARIDEYSDTNVEFHQSLISMSGNALIRTTTDNLFLHMRAIRRRTIGERDRPERSIIDHMHIIEALESRDSDSAERLVREHTLNLARHIELYADYLN